MRIILMKDKLHGIFTGTHFKFPNVMKLSIWLRNPFSPGSIWMTPFFFLQDVMIHSSCVNYSCINLSQLKRNLLFPISLPILFTT